MKRKLFAEIAEGMQALAEARSGKTPHNPAHPGEVLREWLPEGMTVTQAATELHIARVTLSKVLNGQAGISAVMARRLAAWLGTSPESWMGMQTTWD